MGLEYGRLYSKERDYNSHSQKFNDLLSYSYKKLKIMKLEFQRRNHCLAHCCMGKVKDKEHGEVSFLRFWTENRYPKLLSGDNICMSTLTHWSQLYIG